MSKSPTPAMINPPSNNLPMVIDYGDDVGAGMENITREEFKIPLVRILQSNSPQCKPVEGGGIEGAKADMILNTATGEMYDGKAGMGFIPVFRDHNFVEYITRDDGGGFVGMYQPEDPFIAKLRGDQGSFGKLKHYNDTVKKATEIAETFYLFGLLMPDADTVIQGVVPFVSTQISKYQSFVTRYLGVVYPNGEGAKVRPPLWAHEWRLGTVFQPTKKGDIFGWLLRLKEEPPIKSRLRLDDPIYQQARAFYDLLKEGAAKIDREADQKAGGPAADEPGSLDKDDIPF